VRLGVACSEEEGPGVLLGSVVDLLTNRPLPGAAVTLRSGAYGDALLGVTQTDAAGQYVFCDVPRIPGMTLRANLQGITGRALEVPEPRPEQLDPLYLEWSTVVDVVGTVVDGATNQPLPGAVVSLPDRGARSVSNDDGVFRIEGQGAGDMIMTTSALGFATRTDTLSTVSGDLLDLTVVLGVEAIELAPIVVRARSQRESEVRALASRADAMTVAQIDSVLPRVIDFAGLIRNARFPGLGVNEDVDGNMCIEMLRFSRPGCNMVEVFLDGLRLSAAQVVLNAMDPNIVESLQFLDPLEALARYSGPNTQFGVLLIRTRRNSRR